MLALAIASMRLLSWPATFGVIGIMGCVNAPQEVYVPATEQNVKLLVSISTTHLSTGESATLKVERWNIGEWKRVSKKELSPDRCWLVNPPEAHEEEAADNLRWEVSPREGVRFNTNFRSDHTREVVFEKAGTYVLKSSSTVWCRPNVVAEGRPITIVFTEARHRGETER